MSLYHFGVCCVYVLFIADNVKQLTDFYYVKISFQMHVLALTLPLICIFLIRNLRSLLPCTYVASICLGVGLILILEQIFSELPPLSERKMFNTLDRYPYFFGTVLFAMESVGVVSGKNFSKIAVIIAYRNLSMFRATVR